MKTHDKPETPDTLKPTFAESYGAASSELQIEFADRLVTLCDGRPGLRGGIHMDVREPRPDEDSGVSGLKSKVGEGESPACTLDFVASDETLDRYDEIISASGWRLGNYRRNPVFQNAHQYGDIIFTLGKALITEVRGGRLFQRIEFATEVNPMARIAYGLYKGKFLNAVSVGFIPVRWENGPAQSSSASASSSSSVPFRRRYLEQELLEVSAVGIPANPNALQLGLKTGAIEKADLVELLELLRALCDPNHGCPTSAFSLQPLDFCSTAGSETDTSALGAGAYEAQLLHLARVLREILRRA
jgi:hypothetical protein